MTMTSRQRWLAAMNGGTPDRLPFWPKLDGAYARAQDTQFREMPLRALHEWIGSDPHEGIAGCTRDIRTKTAQHSVREGDRNITEFITPRATLRRVDQFDIASQSWHPMEMPVKTVDDIAVLKDWFDDVQVELDTDQLDNAKIQCAQIGESGITANTIGESALMSWVEWFAGVENAHLFLCDYESDVSDLFESMHRVLLRRAELAIANSPADLLYLSENTSTTTISPEQYRRFCLPHMTQYASLANAHGRMLVLHMCGHLKKLLRDLETIHTTAFEAFTSPPVGNTTFMDGRAACPNVCLIGGTNAVLWTKPASVIIAELDRHLALLPHHRQLVITSSGVMPPRATPETIRDVCRWVQKYPARF